jgi:hypothetical protein
LSIVPDAVARPPDMRAKSPENARDSVARQTAPTDKLLEAAARLWKPEEIIWFSQRGALLKETVETDSRHSNDVSRK